MGNELDEFEWKDEYNIGVDEVDNAHRQLFRIVSRIINNFNDKDFDKNKTICIEAVKYLKSYAVKHFSEEEAYQLSIGYKGYDVHKKVHDNMRNVVIPALEKEMTAKDYSKESIEHFIGVCAGWLTAHVLIEDRAITGQVKSKWVNSADDRSIDTLNNIIRGYTSSLFLMNAELFSKNYAGHRLGTLFCYNDVLEVQDGSVYSITLAFEHSMLEVIARRLVKQETMELDSVMLPLISEMLNSFNMDVGIALFGEPPMRKQSGAIPAKNFYAMYDSVYPDYSMLWHTQHGHFVCAVRKLVRAEGSAEDGLF